MSNPPPFLVLEAISKSFTLHLQGGQRIGVMQDVAFAVMPGECVVLGGPSGAGKSSILKMIYGNYRCDRGRILIRDGDEDVDIAGAEPRRILALRKNVMGYVSQFLRVIPRVPTLEIVTEPGLMRGAAREEAEANARTLLTRLRLMRP